MVAARAKTRAPKTVSGLAGLRRGMLEFALLRLIGVERVYVGDILQRLSATAFATQSGTLYPVLGKLRRENLLEHEWRESRAGPPRKYYALTKAGAQRLELLEGHWAQIIAEMDKLAG